MICPGLRKGGAGDETRTRDINLGKVALYQLSYTRKSSQQIFTFFLAGQADVQENFGCLEWVGGWRWASLQGRQRRRVSKMKSNWVLVTQ